VQFFARLETDGLAGGDGDFDSGAGVASNAGLAWLDCENTEAAEFDAVTGYKGLFHAVEDGIDRRLSLGSWEPGAFYNALYEVLFDHEGSPSLGKVITDLINRVVEDVHMLTALAAMGQLSDTELDDLEEHASLCTSCREGTNVTF
jgi:hypothetical protein